MALTEAGARLSAAHRLAQVKLATEVAKVVRAAWPLLDLRDLDASQRRWLAAVVPVVLDGRRRSAALAGVYLRAFAQAEIGADSPAVLAEITDANRAAAETSLRVTGPVTVRALTADGTPLALAGATALEKVLGASVRHVMDGGRETTTRTVQADPNARGYARVASGSACHFCAMLVGRGPVYSEQTVGFDAHDHCTCTGEPVYGGKGYTWPGGQRARDLSDLWAASTKGLSGADARNAFRRAYAGT